MASLMRVLIDMEDSKDGMEPAHFLTSHGAEDREEDMTAHSPTQWHALNNLRIPLQDPGREILAKEIPDKGMSFKNTENY